jgi:hypothetical protein
LAKRIFVPYNLFSKPDRHWLANMNIHSLKTLVFLFAVLSVILACALPVLPSPVSSNPTSDPGLIQTIVVATAGAAQTQTALVGPPPTITETATLPPTLTPTETLTPTATIIFVIPTTTFTSTATRPPTETSEPGSATGEDCELVAQSPANGTVYGSRGRFNAEWTIRNTSDDTWQSDSTDFFFSGGRDMHESDIFDLPRNVRPGGDITFRVEMRAPGNAGTYTSTWTLGTRNNALCTVSVRIRVE